MVTVGVFVPGGVTLNIVQAVQTLSLAVVAFYALRAAGRSADVTR